MSLGPHQLLTRDSPGCLRSPRGRNPQVQRLASRLRASSKGWGPNSYAQIGDNSWIPSGTPVATFLLGSAQSDPVSSYTYNGDGLRISKTVAGTTSQFTWDTQGPNGTPLVLADDTNDYVYGPDGLPLEQVNGSTVTYFLHDQQGSTRFLTDSTGGIVGSFIYDPYGREEAIHRVRDDAPRATTASTRTRRPGSST